MMKRTIEVEPGVAFSLPVGGTASLDGSGTRITFDHVRYDSRCPADVVCGDPEYPVSQNSQPGDASLVVTISRKGSPVETRILNLASPRNETISGDLRIRLEDLTPEPRRSNGYASGRYALLVIARTE
jgi:hypothetical protein